MKLVIDVDDKLYEDSKKLDEYGFGSLPFVETIANGTPLKEETSRPHGEWILQDNYPVCNICKVRALRDDIGIAILSEYCPSCGADMRKKEGEAE